MFVCWYVGQSVGRSVCQNLSGCLVHPSVYPDGLSVSRSVLKGHFHGRFEQQPNYDKQLIYYT